MTTLAQSPLATVQDARRLVRSGIRLTPCAFAPAVSALCGQPIWLKRDDLQRTGSFKERGARHALLRLDPLARLRGVVAAVGMLPPTILMGASQPAIVRWLEASPPAPECKR